MARTRVVIGGIAVLALLGAGYWKYHTSTLPAADATQQTSTTTTGTTPKAGAKRAAQPTLVKLADVTTSDFPVIERSYGTMASPQVVNVNARVASQITKVNVQDGQLVKAGDVLVELDDRTLQATLAKDQATLAKDQAALVNAQIVLDRAQLLFSKSAGAKQDVDTATAAQQAAQKTVDADQAVIDADKLQLDFAKVRAPFDGKLGTVNAVTGALVAASTNSVATSALMTITQMQPLKVNFRLPEQALTALRAKTDATGAATDNSVMVRAYGSGTHDLLDTGKLTFIDSSVDAASGTIALAGEMANTKLSQWPGQRVDVELEYDKITGATTVPTVAIQQGQIGAYVWVVGADNKVKATPVKVARYEGEKAAISDGLTVGQKIVIEGQAKLQDGGEVRTGASKDQKTPDATAAKPAKDEAASGGAEAATPDTGGAMTKKKTTGTTEATQP
ncbi:efflux RND transporter periplasmic adaptor subunit [Aestuariivirga litoralis]|uniref:efflux RND transporter periplasmic adaptor subunit n=1 Tax=Aestuariivirga litoralis TaxID=2650924 RepID=UPI0018C4D707|nr:efflux RND transporter periplasmic adaptor subunit [Aestuariivirga litoralis]